MDMESGKKSYPRSSQQSCATDNYSMSNNKSLLTLSDEEEYSGQVKSQARDSVDEIIRKYKDEKLVMKCKYSNHDLKKKMGEHAIFSKNDDLHSVHNFYNYVEPKYFTVSSNRDNLVSFNYSRVTKSNRTLNEKIGPKVAIKEQDRSYNNSNLEQTRLTSREKLYADKTTYCRPVTSLYNEEFIYRTMVRNSKLKRLVKKLAIARQREKENVNWNNFINDLKNKHGSHCNNSQWNPHQPQPEPEKYITSDVIDDYYNTRFCWQQSRPCNNLLQDFYEGYYMPPQSYYNTDRRSYQSKPQSYSNNYYLPYCTDSHCYPTASQGRITMLERKRQRNEHLNKWHNRFSDNNFRYENNHLNKNNYEKHLSDKRNRQNSFAPTNNNIARTCIESSTVQTDRYLSENLFNNKATNKTENALIHALIQTFEADKKIKERNHNTGSNTKTTSLVNIENKLDTLIDSINCFINEIKLNRKSKQKVRATSVTCELNNVTNNKINMASVSDNYNNIETTNQLLSSQIINVSSESTIENSNFYPCVMPKPSEIDEILKEIDRFCSKDRLYKSKPCSVNITFEVPTRDCSTEVTKSLSKQETGDKVEIIEEISTPQHTPMQRMTIAVNTDPFNFLSLLRISTEALRRLLSSLPNINYQSYLEMFPFPLMPRSVESHFTCNICGIAFTKPSALSDHIETHNLGKTRDCCVCRHVLDTSRKLSKLFKCNFCGQRFTRAYCCELHQQSCAPLLGKTHDVASSLILLK